MYILLTSQNSFQTLKNYLIQIFCKIHEAFKRSNRNISISFNNINSILKESPCLVTEIILFSPSCQHVSFDIRFFILAKKSNLHFNTCAIPQVLQLKTSYQQHQPPDPVSRLPQSQDLRELQSSHGSVKFAVGLEVWEYCSIRGKKKLRTFKQNMNSSPAALVYEVLQEKVMVM